MIGFSDRVDLGEVGVLRDDPTVALRFEVHPPVEPAASRLPLRLRGTAFDTYDGHAWLRSDRDSRTTACSSLPDDTYPLYRAPEPEHDRSISIDLDPIEPPVVFLPPRAVALHVRTPTPYLLAEPPTLRCGGEDEIRYANSDYRGIRYEAFIAGDSEILAKPLIDRDRRSYLGVPSDMPPRVAELARAWTAGAATPDAKARAIQEHLRTGFGYDLHSPSQGAPQPIDHFLFESRRGHCEFFSTTMAIMLRTVGVPSRNITGFIGGTWNRFGHYYAIRQGDAHSWVEAYIDLPARSGWQTYDPTPTAGVQPQDPPSGFYYYARDFVEAVSQRWNTYVVGYDLRKQIGLIEDIRRQYDNPHSPLGGLHGTVDSVAPFVTRTGGLLGAVAIAYAVWRHRRRRLPSPGTPRPHRADDARQATASALYRGVEAALRASGIARPPDVPPLAHAESLRKENHPLSACVLHVTRLYLSTRFGGVAVTDSVRSEFRRAIGSIRAFRPGRPAAG
jgi:transglutaminase-like putative cysteine protease